MLIKKLLKYYRTSAPAAPHRGTEEEKMRYYRKLRWSAFLAGTIGYSLYYVCRTTLNVVKQPIMEAGLLDAKQLGTV